MIILMLVVVVIVEVVDSSSGSSYRGMLFFNDYFLYFLVMYKCFIQELVDDIEVDMELEEVKEICKVVILLIIKFFNYVEESMFFCKFSDVLRCGSMVEGIRIWKFIDDNEKIVLEFDFLLVLEKIGVNDFVVDNLCYGFMNIK